jgi:hypothetical protein
MNKEKKTGKGFPLGAAACPDGVNFSVFAKFPVMLASFVKRSRPG